jgi:hypothetical protein
MEMSASRFPAVVEHAAAETAPVQVSALRLMDITDDEAASLIRPAFSHPHQPITLETATELTTDDTDSTDPEGRNHAYPPDSQGPSACVSIPENLSGTRNRWVAWE